LGLGPGSFELRLGDADQPSGDAARATELREQLARHGVHGRVGEYRCRQCATRLPRGEVGVAQLHRDGVGDQAIRAQVGGGPVHEGEQLTQ
jgi:hypothetical protein